MIPDFGARSAGLLNVNSRANFTTWAAICDHCSLRIDRSKAVWQLRGNDSLFLSITHRLLLRCREPHSPDALEVKSIEAPDLGFRNRRFQNISFRFKK
jgi:hypothetical protein